MPRHCYPGAPYGCNHTEEHRRAALLGWARRRGADREYQRFKRAEEDLSVAYGSEVTRVHRHKSHPGEVRFLSGGQWYRMSNAEFADLEKSARRARRELEAEQARAKRMSASQEKKAARAAKAQAKYRDEMERWAAREQARIDTGIRKRLRTGGIRPSRHVTYRKTRGKEVPVDYGEWERLPKSLRKRGGIYTLDEVRHVLYEEGAISADAFDDFTADDAFRYIESMQERLERSRTRSRQRKAEKAA